MEDKFFDSDMFGSDSSDGDDISFSSMLSAINGDGGDEADGAAADAEAAEDIGAADADDAVTDGGYDDGDAGEHDEFPPDTEDESDDEFLGDESSASAQDARDCAADAAEQYGAQDAADGAYEADGSDAAYADAETDDTYAGDPDDAYAENSDAVYADGASGGYDDAADDAVNDCDASSADDVTEEYGEADTAADEATADSGYAAEPTYEAPAAPKAVPLSALHRDAELSTGHGRRSKGKRRKSAEPKKKLTPGCVVRRILASVLAAVIIAIYLVLTVIFVLVKGPSPSAKRLFVLSVKETSAAGFLANIFLPDDEVDAILAAQEQSAAGNDETTDSSLISIDKKPETDAAQSDVPANAEPEDPGDGIEIIEVKKESFNGIIMKIADPKRVFLGVPDTYGETAVGLTLRQMAAKYGALGGINAGGFYDPNGSGKGGIPDGLVINDGELIWGNATTAYNVIGFDGDGILHVGSMTGNTALSLGIKYACCFGPTLVVNGKACNARGSLGGGMNPRTAIGQTADGSVLFVVINGRSLGSLGATYDDLTDLLIEYGAVNGSNLDGGSSSLLLYNGELLNVSASVIGERELPTAFLVK